MTRLGEQRPLQRAIKSMIGLSIALAFNAVANGHQPHVARKAAFIVNQGDHIVFIGNTFAERLQLFGYFESMLVARFPDHQLTIRNLGWSADTVTLMPRPLNFGGLDTHLENKKADVIVMCFGMNESFAGLDRLSTFRQELTAFTDRLQAHTYNGTSPPRIVLVSPIAHENLGPPLPAGVEHNKSLKAYTGVMADVAVEKNLLFVDLFSPTMTLMNEPAGRMLTFNGIHLTEHGYWTASRIMARSLGLIPEGVSPVDDPDGKVERLRQAIYDKNKQFFLRWRARNAEYIYGRRRKPYGVQSFPPEMETLDRMIRKRDHHIWKMPKPSLAQIWGSVPPGR